MTRALILLITCAAASLGAQQSVVAARFGQGTVMPILDSRQKETTLPALPPETKATVRVQTVVGKDGSVLHTRVAASPDMTGALDQVAVGILKGLKFRAATDTGGPVAVLVQTDVDFQPALKAGDPVRASVLLGEVPRDLQADAPDAWARSRTVTPGIQAPRVIREIRPSYTSAAMRAKVMGTVALDIVIDVDGTVASVRVTKSLDKEFGLDREAVLAARYWLFEPARLNGEPVASTVQLELEFRLH